MRDGPAAKCILPGCKARDLTTTGVTTAKARLHQQKSKTPEDKPSAVRRRKRRFTQAGISGQRHRLRQSSQHSCWRSDTNFVAAV